MDAHVLNAKRYAHAFLNLFTINSQDITNIKKAIDFLEHHREIFSLLKVPLLDSKIKMNALKEYLMIQFYLPASFEKLIHVLVEQKRTYLIQMILSEMINLYEDQQGLESFTIASSCQLDDTELEKVKAFLTTHTHHNIICTPLVDTDLIAGIRMQSNNHLWEYSIRKHLAAIKSLMLE